MLAGLATAAQMLYFGAVLQQPMRLGGASIEPTRLRAAGAIMAMAGILAAAVMIAEILSGAAGTDLRAFFVATLLIPPVVTSYNAWRNRA